MSSHPVTPDLRQSAPDQPIDRSFVRNSTWSMIGVGANAFVGIVLSPYVVRLLGVERFGVWALIFAILDYLWLFDLGFTPAIANLITRYLARREYIRINEVVNTAACYFAGLGLQNSRRRC